LGTHGTCVLRCNLRYGLHNEFFDIINNNVIFKRFKIACNNIFSPRTDCNPNICRRFKCGEGESCVVDILRCDPVCLPSREITREITREKTPGDQEDEVFISIGKNTTSIH